MRTIDTPTEVHFAQAQRYRSYDRAGPRPPKPTTVNPGALDLSRLQFAFTVSFHIVFPAMSIGLARFLAVRWWERS
ncbi:hypothetical protein AYM40_29815 [Paraburkholderia phytofirmans OLGA172]|uniref:Cytochrome ubiquinol oxidase subunit I n=1 Tax=Paraburkholderia phytofirmans OLGA172 TaxID=1417228 RepID=A0A160FTD6_9BURK|nr:hypothetical protein AYM40_29815 [Paraburkholderia phytofirmans OLGA172]